MTERSLSKAPAPLLPLGAEQVKVWVLSNGLVLADAACFVQISVSKCQMGMANTANDAEINDFSVIISCPISECVTELACNWIPKAETEVQGLS